MGDVVLAMNAGSSSLKMASYGISGAEQRLIQRAAVEHIGMAASRLWVHDRNGAVVIDQVVEAADHVSALDRLLAATGGTEDVVAVGHRVVYGGPAHQQPELITDALLSDLDVLVDLDPLHLPPALAVIRSAQKWLTASGHSGSAHSAPNHVACFDTAFHRTMPDVARRYPLPDALWAEGVRRYGFHGLVAESIVEQLPDAGRLVIAHLGSGVSITAVLDGQSMDTTMGFTPTGGVMMATRSGDLDPGVLVHLIEHLGYSPAQLRTLTSEQSGLLAVSGTTGNMAELVAVAPHDERAARAIEMFSYQVSKAIGSMAVVLDGVDTLVFSGGIGERSPLIRSMIVDRLGSCGLFIDDERNRQSHSLISAVEDRGQVRVVAVDEEQMIARHARAVSSTRRR